MVISETLNDSTYIDFCRCVGFIKNAYYNISFLNFWLQFVFNVTIKHDNIVVSKAPTIQIRA